MEVLLMNCSRRKRNRKLYFIFWTSLLAFLILPDVKFCLHTEQFYVSSLSWAYKNFNALKIFGLWKVFTCSSIRAQRSSCSVKLCTGLVMKWILHDPLKQLRFKLFLLISGELRHIGDIFNYVSHIMLHCTTVKETEQESAWIVSCWEVF